MRPKSMILILIALVCGLIASIGISQVIDRGGGEADIQMQQIYVAVEDIAIREELNAQRVKLENWPVDRVPMGAVTSPEQLEGKAPRQPLFAGEPILLGKLADKGALDSASTRIKPGHRVMSVKVSMDTAVSHLIQPGDHVDILAFVQGRRGGDAKAETILENIEVFAINSQFSRNAEQEENSSIQAKTVSLQVTPDQANNLVYYAEQGRLRLTLRSPDEEGAQGEGGHDYRAGRSNTVAVASPANPEPTDQEIEFDGKKMEILDNSGNARVYGWQDGDDEGLPQELTPKEMRKSHGGSSSDGPTASSNEGSSTRPPAPEVAEPDFGDDLERKSRGIQF